MQLFEILNFKASKESALSILLSVELSGLNIIEQSANPRSFIEKAYKVNLIFATKTKLII